MIDWKYIVVVPIITILGAFGCGGDTNSFSGDPGGPPVDVSEGLVGIRVVPATASVGLNQSFSFLAVGTYQDGSERDVSRGVEWSVQPQSVAASVSATGVLRAEAIGYVFLRVVEPRTQHTAGAIAKVEARPQEGSPAAPVDVELGAIHDGKVNTGLSFYRVPIEPDLTYYVFLSSVTDEIRVRAYDTPALTTVLCEDNGAGLDPSKRLCVTNPRPASSSLYVVVDGAFTDPFFGGTGGATYSMRVLRGYRNEGVETPVALTVGGAYAGEVGLGTSTYSVAVTEGAQYTVTIDGLIDDALLHVNGPLGTVISCTNDLPGTSSESCVLRPGGATLSIEIYGGRTLVGTPHTLTVAMTDDPKVAQGSIAAPVDVTGLLPYVGEVDHTASYYKATVTPGASYRVRVSDMEAELWAYVSDDDASFANYDCYGSTGSAHNQDIVCEMMNVTSATLFIRVSGTSAPHGTAFRLEIEPVVFAAQGTAGAPMTVGPAPVLLRTGEVDATQSYYAADVVAGARYRVRLTEIKGAVALGVYGDAARTVSLCSASAGTTTVECTTATRPSGATLQIVVDGTNPHGSRFELAVDRVYDGEGSTSAPVALALNTARASQVGPGAGGQSYFAAGVSAGTAYRVSVTQASVWIFVQVYGRTADFGTTPLCSGWASPGSPMTCDHTASTSTLAIQVSAITDELGTGFLLTVAPQ